MSRVAFAVLALVTFAQCGNLENLAKTWYPVGYFVSEVSDAMPCDPFEFVVEERKQKCGEFDGHYIRDFTKFTRPLAIGFEVSSYEDAIRALNGTCDVNYNSDLVMAFRFFDNYAASYHIAGITAVTLYSSSKPTEEESRSALKYLPEVNGLKFKKCKGLINEPTRI